MVNNKIARKLISIFVSIAFIMQLAVGFSPVAYAIPTEPFTVNITQTRQDQENLDVENLMLPLRFGEITDAHKGTLDRTIIHIQDAHCNYSAQHSIAGLIDHISSTYGVNLVALEGGKGDYDLSVFTDIEDPGARKVISDFFVKEGIVNGAEFYAVNSGRTITLYGIENTDLYLEDLNAYREFLPLRADAVAIVLGIEREIGLLKQRIYSPELIRFDDMSLEYDKKEIELKDYIVFLSVSARALGIDLSPRKNLKDLLDIIENEKTIDFRKANLERNALIDKMRGKLSQKELTDLAQKSAAFGAGDISKEDYYNYLFKKSGVCGVDLNGLPNLLMYAEYVKRYEKVDKRAFMGELKGLENDSYAVLCKTEDQKKLHELERRMSILKKMFDISFMREDWDLYRQNKPDFESGRLIELMKFKGAKFTGKDDIRKLDAARIKIEKFYECSFKRDSAFVKNIEMKMKETGTNELILVTGGFHTDNLKTIFSQKGYSYVQVMPKIGKSEPDCPYMRLLSGERLTFQPLLTNGLEYLAKWSAIAILDIFSEKMREMGQEYGPVDMDTVKVVTKALQDVAVGKGLGAEDAGGMLTFGDFGLALSEEKPVSGKDLVKSFDINGKTLYMVSVAGEMAGRALRNDLVLPEYGGPIIAGFDPQGVEVKRILESARSLPDQSALKMEILYEIFNSGQLSKNLWERMLARFYLWRGDLSGLTRLLSSVIRNNELRIKITRMDENGNRESEMNLDYGRYFMQEADINVNDVLSKAVEFIESADMRAFPGVVEGRERYVLGYGKTGKGIFLIDEFFEKGTTLNALPLLSEAVLHEALEAVTAGDTHNRLYRGINVDVDGRNIELPGVQRVIFGTDNPLQRRLREYIDSSVLAGSYSAMAIINKDTDTGSVKEFVERKGADAVGEAEAGIDGSIKFKGDILGDPAATLMLESLLESTKQDRAPPDMPPGFSAGIKFHVIKDTRDVLGIPKFRGAAQVSDKAYAYSNFDEVTGTLDVYITEAFHDRCVSDRDRFVPILAETLDYEIARKIFGWDERTASARAWYFAEKDQDGTVVSLGPFHGFLMEELSRTDAGKQVLRKWIEALENGERAGDALGDYEDMLTQRIAGILSDDIIDWNKKVLAGAPWKKLFVDGSEYTVDGIVSLKGGMGGVLRASDKDNKIIALKMISKDWRGMGSFTDEFRREGEILASLKDVNGVVKWLGNGYDPDMGHFIAMEYLEGWENLDDFMSREFPNGIVSKDDLARVLRIMQDISGIVAEMHKKGIVYCDIKDMNFMINGAGEIKIIDFGISYRPGKGEEAPTAGTITYMAPEQVYARDRMGERTDVFATGILFERLLTSGMTINDISQGKKENELSVDTFLEVRVEDASNEERAGLAWQLKLLLESLYGETISDELYVDQFQLIDKENIAAIANNKIRELTDRKGPSWDEFIRTFAANDPSYNDVLRDMNGQRDEAWNRLVGEVARAPIAGRLVDAQAYKAALGEESLKRVERELSEGEGDSWQRVVSAYNGEALYGNEERIKDAYDDIQRIDQEIARLILEQRENALTKRKRSLRRELVAAKKEARGLVRKMVEHRKTASFEEKLFIALAVPIMRCITTEPETRLTESRLRGEIATAENMMFLNELETKTTYGDRRNPPVRSPKLREFISNYPGSLELKRINRGEELVGVGEKVGGLYIIAEGSFELTKKDKNGVVIENVTMTPGNVYGESSFFGEGISSVTVTAAENGRYLFLPREIYEKNISDLLGERKYRVFLTEEAKIGAGGMGEVYKGRDTETGELVAVKLLKQEDRLKKEDWERKKTEKAELVKKAERFREKHRTFLEKNEGFRRELDNILALEYPFNRNTNLGQYRAYVNSQPAFMDELEGIVNETKRFFGGGSDDEIRKEQSVFRKNQLFEVERDVAEAMKDRELTGVVRFMSSGEDEEKGQYIVMEYLEGWQGLDQNFRSRFPNGVRDRQELYDVLSVYGKIADVIDRVHEESNIEFYDFKLDNILIDPETEEIKLLDFGGCVYSGASVPGSEVGSVGLPAYQPPEVLEGRFAPKKSDVYKMGLALIETISGKPIWKLVPTQDEVKQSGGSAVSALMYVRLLAGAEMDRIIAVYGETERRIGEDDGLHEAVREILEGSLEFEPEKRMSAADISEKIRTLLKNIEIEAFVSREAVDGLRAGVEASAGYMPGRMVAVEEGNILNFMGEIFDENGQMVTGFSAERDEEAGVIRVENGGAKGGLLFAKSDKDARLDGKNKIELKVGKNGDFVPIEQGKDSVLKGEMDTFLAGELMDKSGKAVVYELVGSNKYDILGVPDNKGNLYLQTPLLNSPIARFHEVGEYGLAAILAESKFELPNGTNSHTFLRGCGKDVRDAYGRIGAPQMMDTVTLIASLNGIMPRKITEAEAALIKYNSSSGYQGRERLFGLQDKVFGEVRNDWFTNDLKSIRSGIVPERDMDGKISRIDVGSPEGAYVNVLMDAAAPAELKGSVEGLKNEEIRAFVRSLIFENISEAMSESLKNLWDGEETVINIPKEPFIPSEMAETSNELSKLYTLLRSISNKMVNKMKIGNITINLFEDTADGRKKLADDMDAKMVAWGEKADKRRIVTFSFADEKGVENKEVLEKIKSMSFVTYMTPEIIKDKSGKITGISPTPVDACISAGIRVLNLFELEKREKKDEARIAEAQAFVARGIVGISGSIDADKADILLENIKQIGLINMSGLIYIKIGPVDLNEIADFHMAEIEVMRSL